MARARWSASRRASTSSSNGNNTFDATGTATPLVVTAGTGSDIITGGNGNDTISVGDATVSPFYNQINAGSSRADGMDVYIGGPAFDYYDASTRTATNWLSNNGLPNSGEGTCPGANPACEGDNIATSIDEMISGSGNDHLVAGAADTYLGGNGGDDNLDANPFTGVVVDNWHRDHRAHHDRPHCRDTDRWHGYRWLG